MRQRIRRKRRAIAAAIAVAVVAREMALIAEEVVEEWLNQQGFFTIRGIKLGVQEMDILALRFDNGKADLRHYEVQASVNPVSYISRVPKSIQREEGRSASSAKKRSLEELRVGVQEWIDKKFLHPKKMAIRDDLFCGDWAFHFVVNEVFAQEELGLFEKSQVSITRFESVLSELKNKSERKYTASGKDLVDLILMDRG